MHAAQHEAQQAADGVDVGARVGLGETVLLGRGISPGTERSGVARGLGVACASDAQVDEVRSVCGHDDVGRRDVAVDDARGVQGPSCLAYLSRQVERLRLTEPAFCLHETLEYLAGHVVVHDDEAIGQLVGCFHMGKTSAVAFGQDGPNASIGQLKGDFLAHERAGAANRHKLGGAVGFFGEHALDVVAVVYAHGVQDLFVGHAHPPFPSRQIPYSNLVGGVVPQLATELCECGLVLRQGLLAALGRRWPYWSRSVPSRVFSPRR